MDADQGAGLLVGSYPYEIAVAAETVNVTGIAIFVDRYLYDVVEPLIEAGQSLRFGADPQVAVFVRNDLPDVVSHVATFGICIVTPDRRDAFIPGIGYTCEIGADPYVVFFVFV